MSVFIKKQINNVNFYCKISLCQSVYVQYVQVMTEKLNLYYLDNICLMKGQNLLKII